MSIVDGYSLICPECNARHGLKKSGPRDLDIKLCKPCLQLRSDAERERFEASQKPEKKIIKREYTERMLANL